MNSQTPLSLYIHIPWCEKKCPYCDFNSHLAKAEVDEDAYIQALLSDLEQDLKTYHDEIAERSLSSIFIGGGTPSLFSASSYKTLIEGLKSRIAFDDDIEITSEANPGSSEAEKFIGFREAGINRLSIGIQSFNKSHLKALGRVHNNREALNAVDFANRAGFENINLDIMFGLPQQSFEQAIEDIQTAIELQTTHLSCYQLTIEPNTLFHHKPPVTPDDELLWTMQEAIQAQLFSNEFEQYEVSAYAKPKQQCKHNLNYWQFGDYLGIGAGAHGKLSKPNGGILRTWKIKHPANYLRADQPFTGGTDHIDKQLLSFEFMMNALRLRDGFTQTLFQDRTGLPIKSIQQHIDKHLEQGLINITHEHIKPTARGRQMIDSMLQDYLLDAEQAK